ncbi:MAG TPA: PAS domain S-box protein [Gallionella sp.]|nr:PAS domain S-box protein [Gallionella sp.]HUW76283.1 PAS domain S-box protein [Gallionella sp.]
MSKRPDENSTLRAEAEARLAGAQPPEALALSAEVMLHELQVHQIELEMQNEELRRMQLTLEESRDRYVDLYELAPVGYLTLTDTGMIAEINLTCAALLGEERQRLVQRRFSAYVASGGSDRWQRLFINVLRHGNKESCELAMQRSDGSSFDAQLDCLRKEMADGALHVRIILTDITERKQNELLLRESEERLRAIVDQVVVGIVRTDLAGHITFVNDRFCDISGYTRKELLDKQWQDLTHPEDMQNSISVYKQMMQDGQPLSFEKRYIRKNGMAVWVSISASRLSDAEGHVIGGLAVVVDISRRKLAEDALRKSSEEIADLYNHSPCGYHSLDKDGIIRQINDTELAWLGYTRDEVIGKTTAADILTPASMENFWKSYPLFIKRGFIQDLELEMVRKDGTTFTGLASATAIYGPGGHYVMSRSTILDITERKQLERRLLEYRNEMNNLLNLQVAAQTAAAIAHELNQPLLAISSYSGAARMLLQTEKPDLVKIRKAVMASEQQAQRAGKSIRELLEFLSIKEFPVEAFDLNQEILGVLDTARSEHELKFHYMLHLEAGLPQVWGNRMHVHKVLLNLLHNGIEAMQQAGVPSPSLTVTLSSAKNKGFAQVTIQDNGPGIDKVDLQHLFEPFFTTKSKGMGMGLAVSRSLIEMNGGQLWLEPQQGHGAIFHFTLPFAI